MERSGGASGKHGFSPGKRATTSDAVFPTFYFRRDGYKCSSNPNAAKERRKSEMVALSPDMFALLKTC